MAAVTSQEHQPVKKHVELTSPSIRPSPIPASFFSSSTMNTSSCPSFASRMPSNLLDNSRNLSLSCPRGESGEESKLDGDASTGRTDSPCIPAFSSPSTLTHLAALSPSSIPLFAKCPVSFSFSSVMDRTGELLLRESSLWTLFRGRGEPPQVEFLKGLPGAGTSGLAPADPVLVAAWFPRRAGNGELTVLDTGAFLFLTSGASEGGGPEAMSWPRACRCSNTDALCGPRSRSTTNPDRGRFSGGWSAKLTRMSAGKNKSDTGKMWM